jgi:phenylacetate-coenzyme A ligase PaaK-like adenylate-forming protein/2-polyprenyl-3-methyl-5-hydroxy-6-metoxy-1,4-benzoquinol methylase/glycosyltransferase involved in cell wall biosynthesis
VSTGELSERLTLEKRKLGLVIDRQFHEKNRWCSATTFHLVEALKKRFECIYIQNQKDYENNVGDIDLLISMEPGWAAPVLEFCRTQVLREQLSAIPSYIFYSDPHSNKWREDYFLANRLGYVLSFYWTPFRHHFTRIDTSQIVHFPWAIPDHWVDDSPIVFQGQKKICCFGGQRSEAYELRNWCRSFDFVESAVNSGVENKVMSESEYIDWLRQRDAAIAAGSDSPKYKLTTPKYFEIAAAGSLLFAQKTDDLALLGIEHKRNSIIFERSDFEQLAEEYLANPETYLQIRRAGRELICQRHLLSQRINLLAEHASMVLERKTKRENLRRNSKSVESSETAGTVLGLTDREYWDRERKKEFEPWEVKETQFSHILEKYLPENDKFSCVEIGAYPGANLCYLAKRFKYYPVAIEYSEHCDHIEKLLRFNGIEKFKVLKQDFFEPVNMKFDVVTSFGFVEHFENYEEVIDRHVELLKPGGYLVMSCPYLDNFQGKLRELVYTEEKLQQVLSSHNLRIMNLDEIKRVLSKYDMEICLADFIMGNKIWFDPNADYIKPQMKWLVKYLLTVNAAGGERIPSSKLYSPMIMVIARHKSNVRKKSSGPVSIQDVLEQRQWFSREKIEKSQWEDLKSLLAHSYNNVPFYRRRFDELGIRPEDIRNIDDFRKIPVLKKSEIQQRLENMKAGNCPQGQLLRDATGGSTGQPLVFYRDFNAKMWIDAACVRFRRWIGYGPRSKLALIWGADRDVPSSYPPNQRWLNTFNCGEQDIEKFVAELVQWKPDAIRAYASSLYMVASYIKSRGLQAPRPKVIESAAEKLWDGQRRVVEDVFGCKVFEMYGSREIPALACECEYHNGMHIFSDLRIVEVIKDERPAKPGEEGSIVITDLVNYGMPFIRYEIGDIGVISKESCQCGRGLKEIKGRITSTIHTPDGRRIHGEYFTHLFYDITGVKAFQVHQTKLDEVIVSIQPDKSLNENQIGHVIAKVRSHLGERVNVKCRYVDDIPVTASGKRHFTISDVPADFAGTGAITLSSTTAVSAADSQGKKNILFIVDQPGWAHDFKTDNIIRRLGDRFNITKRYEDNVFANDITKADVIVLYYWRQFNHSNMPGLLDELIRSRHKLLIGICSHQEMAHDRDEVVKVIRYLASGIFVNSMLLYREFSPFFEVPVFYTPNGVDTKFFTPASERQANQKLRVGWAGSITNHGDTRGYHDLILPATSAVEGVELAVAAREDKWRNRDEMLEFYRSLDVYICASAAEGTPNPCLEAAACGVPLLTTRVGNMPELIEDGKNGLFIERDINDIKNKLIVLRDNPDLRLKMSAEILKSIKEWDWELQAKNYRRMFEQMLHKQGHGYQNVELSQVSLKQNCPVETIEPVDNSCIMKKETVTDLGGNGERVDIYYHKDINYDALDKYQKSHYRRYQFAQSVMEPGKVVGDFACGTGYGSVMLAENENYVIGADVSEEVIEHIRERYNDSGNVEFIHSNLLDLQFESFFDYIVSFETIEHLNENDISKVLRIYSRALKPGGTLIFSTPYIQERSENAIKMGFHQTFYIDEAKVNKWLTESGFEAECFKYQNYQTHDIVERLDKKDFIICTARICKPVYPKELKPKVSILIPTYNRAQYLKKAIDSAISQTYPHIEIVVLDDCSTDNTAEAVKVYSNIRNFKYIRNEQNIGFIRNWNRAVLSSCGEYIMCTKMLGSSAVIILL